MPVTVGELEFEPMSPGPWSWVFGAAPQLPPFWELFHRSWFVARLVLLFEDDDGARDEIGAWLDRTSIANGAGSVTDYMERQLQDLTVAADLSVANVQETQRLRHWMHDVVERRISEIPDEFATIEHDMVLLPPRESYPGQFALVRESSFGNGVTVGLPRRLTWAV